MIGELATWYLFLAGAGAGALLVTAVLELQTPFASRCYAPVFPVSSREALAGQRSEAMACEGGALYRRSSGKFSSLDAYDYSEPTESQSAFSAGSAPMLFATGPRLLSQAAVPVVPREPFQRFFGPAYGVGLVAVLVGMFFLLADLGRPDRILALLLNPTLSFISVGVYLLLFLSLCSALLCAIWLFGAAGLPRWLVAASRVGVVVGALAVMTYTGLLLASMPSIPFWNNAWIPLLFVASDISAGIGLMVAAIVLCGNGSTFHSTLLHVKSWDVVMLAAQLFCLVLLLVTAFFRGPTAEASAKIMLSGNVAPQFWIMVVGMGLIFPFLAERFGHFGSQRMMLVVSAALLISCFFLRWCVVQVGLAPDIAMAVMTALGSG